MSCRARSLRALSVALLALSLSTFPSFDCEARSYSGSISFSVTQRYFFESSFGSGGRFSEFPAPLLEVNVGLYEFPFGLELLSGFSYINKTSKGIIAENGQVSQDKFQYQFLTWSAGARYKLWKHDFYFLIPYGEAQLTYRFGRFKKLGTTLSGPSNLTGGDFGGIITAGVLISFFYDEHRALHMKHMWDLQDFGAVIFGRLQPSGLFKHGLGSVDSTGGYDFGVGLLLDW